MIRLQNVTFAYGKTPVLQNISLVEDRPAIIGLWGRNGAGKTSLMKLLAGHLRPAEGEVEIMDVDPYDNAQARQYLCFMQEEHPFISYWSVNDVLRFGRYFNVGWDEVLAERLIELFQIDRQKKIPKLSKGMKGALQFVVGLASRARITILDEPTNGLDAGMRKEVYRALRESHENHPRVIIFSTHHIEEVHPICESLIVLDGGALLLRDPIEDVRNRGVWVVGAKHKVEEFIGGQPVIERTSAGSMLKVMLDVPDSEEWRSEAQRQGVSIEKAQLQDYLLNITANREVVE